MLFVLNNCIYVHVFAFHRQVIIKVYIVLQPKSEILDSLFTLIEFFSNNGIIFVKPSGLNYDEICLTYSSFIGF